MDSQEILSLVDAFASGADTSLVAANRLEVLLDDLFPDDDYLQETVEMLACYRPGGGNDVLGEEIIRERLIGVREYLKTA
jgi:hypothetical protein